MLLDVEYRVHEGREMVLTFACAVASGGESGVVVLVWVRSGWECFSVFDESGRLLCEEGREEGLARYVGQ